MRIQDIKKKIIDTIKIEAAIMKRGEIDMKKGTKEKVGLMNFFKKERIIKNHWKM